MVTTRSSRDPSGTLVVSTSICFRTLWSHGLKRSILHDAAKSNDPTTAPSSVTSTFLMPESASVAVTSSARVPACWPPDSSAPEAFADGSTFSSRVSVRPLMELEKRSQWQ